MKFRLDDKDPQTQANLDRMVVQHNYDWLCHDAETISEYDTALWYMKERKYCAQYNYKAPGCLIWC